MIKIKRTGKFDLMLKELIEQDEALLNLVEEKTLLFAKNLQIHDLKITH